MFVKKEFSFLLLLISAFVHASNASVFFEYFCGSMCDSFYLLQKIDIHVLYGAESYGLYIWKPYTHVYLKRNKNA